MRPNFFIVGAPKCGTTSMYHSLRRHPEIFMPWDESRFWLHKEPNYFNTDLEISDAYKVSGEQAYLDLFRTRNGESRIGEATTFYLYSKVAAGNISRFDPEARIIIMIRNPIDLVYSWHGDCLRWGHENLINFMEAFRADPEREAGRRVPAACGYPELLVYRKMGLLADGIERFYEAFDPEQVLVLTLDQLKKRPQETYAAVLGFLGVDTSYSPEPAIHNRRKEISAAFVRTKRMWIRYLELTQEMPFLPSRVPSFAKPFLEGVLNRSSKPLDASGPTEAERAYLYPFFADDITRLEGLLGRDLSHWRIAEPSPKALGAQSQVSRV